ncbi:MAG: imidazole glycerol phosphate synthase subunit HisH [Acidobacteria bacterium]|nr:imidazole glycerol phosphate synthase subunit HisH [Acidobacteriota bacterium]
MTIGIVDYGGGNLRSLENALARLGLPCRRLTAARAVAGTDRLVLPGVGHFGAASEQLAVSGLGEAVRAVAGRGGRVLGVCLGMQLLFESSAEAPGARGLGLLPGCFRRLGEAPFAGGPPDRPLKVPHTGWDRVDFGPGRPAGWFYFVHAYALPASDVSRDGLEAGWCDHGGPFLASLRRGGLAGAQFHPEKSGEAGLQFLEEVLS